MKTWQRWVLGGVLGIVVASGAGLALTWTPDVPVAQLKARWALPPSQFIDVDGLAVHVRDEGQKDSALTPLVLVHGTSASLHTWDGWVRELTDPARNPPRRIVRLDLPAFGLTGPNAANDYSLDAYVRLVAQVMDKLGIAKAVVAGNSLGGHVAWRMASDLPQRVERAILVDASGYTMRPISVPIGFIAASTPVLRHVLPYTLSRPLVANGLHSVYGDPSKVTPELVDLYYDITRREGNRKALVRRLQQGYEDDPVRIRSIRQPTLILWGGKDQLIPPVNGQRFAKDIQGSRLVVFDDLGHVPHEEDPVRTAAAVRAFLAQ
jgi:pimeloyl-ACP methyl ester carboxylesterase